MPATLGACEVIGLIPVADLDLEDGGLYEITTQHAPYADFSTLGYAFDAADAKRFAASGALLAACKRAGKVLWEHVHTPHTVDMSVFAEVEAEIREALSSLEGA